MILQVSCLALKIVCCPDHRPVTTLNPAVMKSLEIGILWLFGKFIVILSLQYCLTSSIVLRKDAIQSLFTRVRAIQMLRKAKVARNSLSLAWKSQVRNPGIRVVIRRLKAVQYSSRGGSGRWVDFRITSGLGIGEERGFEMVNYLINLSMWCWKSW